MICGETHEEARATAEAERSWHPYFAKYPVQLICGRYAWLASVLRRRSADPHVIYEYAERGSRPVGYYSGKEDEELKHPGPI